VAEFGLVLRNSEYKGSASFTGAYALIKDLDSIKGDPYKVEFMNILRVLAD